MTMTMKSRFPAAALALSLAGGGVAFAQSALPPVKNSSGVEMLSGGVGRDQAEAMQAESARWPLMLEFSVAAPQRADYAANVKVAIRKGGATVVQTISDGPLLLLRLPTGHYEIEATLDGRTLRKSISVSASRPSKLGFQWPAGTNS